jgi:hypothetical protein
MPWDRSAPVNPKYRTAEHRNERRRWARILKREGVVLCAQAVCVMPSREIHDGERWHLGHDDSGQHYIGPVHPLCNVKDGAKRARARQGRRAPASRRWVL